VVAERIRCRPCNRKIAGSFHFTTSSHSATPFNKIDKFDLAMLKISIIITHCPQWWTGELHGTAHHPLNTLRYGLCKLRGDIIMIINLLVRQLYWYTTPIYVK